jgi:pyridoxamine 5'-phosphate oxidase
MQNIASLRKEYTKEQLDISTVDNDPLQQFHKWFQEALQAEVLEANAMCLSTLKNDGRPSARIVLLKGIVNNKFQFYTNYQSQKGRELETNPACALTFFWAELERQVRVEGIASRLSADESLKYFQSRPRGSQLGAWTSPQSSIIKDRSVLEGRLKQMTVKFESIDPLPKPQQWGGYEVDPLEIEFWQGRPNRLHDRILFTKVNDKWIINRLAP